MDSYTIVVTKLPQEASDSLAVQMSIYTNLNKRTISYSLDDTVYIMQNELANERSHVEVVNPEEASQVATIARLEELGIAWVPITLDKQLAMPVNYSQRDPEWEDYPIGGGHTIGSWGCLEVVYSNMAVMMRLCDDKPDAFVERMIDARTLVNGFVQPAALSTMFPELVGYDGWSTSNTEELIRQQIDKGIPVPCRVDLDASSSYTQHWVLAIGYTPYGDIILADPWPYPAFLGYQSGTIYDRILEVLLYNTEPEPEPEPEPGDTVDMFPFFSSDTPNSILYELATEIDGEQVSQERCQLQQTPDASYMTKASLFEQIRKTETHLQRGIDTSPNASEWYVLTQNANELFVNWLKRYMTIGETYVSMPVVTSYSKGDCQVTKPSQSTNDYLTLDAVYDSFEGFNGVRLGRTIKISWRKTPDNSTVPNEVYFYTEGMGLTGWGEDHSGKEARVSEIHAPGQRPDNEKAWYCIKDEWRL